MNDPQIRSRRLKGDDIVPVTLAPSSDPEAWDAAFGWQLPRWMLEADRG